MDKTFSIEEIVGGPVKYQRERYDSNMEFNLWDRGKANDKYEEIIIEGTSGKFYDFERVYEACKDWDIPPYLIFPVGTRGVGKTRVLMDLFMDAVKGGLTTIWTRNFESTFLKPTFYKGFLNLGKRLCGVPEEFTAKPEGVYTDEKGGDLVCMFKSINMGTELKGNEYRDVKYVLSDEFMVLPSERYPTGCGEKLSTMLGSLRSYVDCCVMCSNFTYITNPYWADLRIFPKKNAGVSLFKKDATVIEVCEKGYYNMTAFKDDDPRSNVIRKLGGHDQSSYENIPNFELIQKVQYKHLSQIEFYITTGSMDLAFYVHPSGMIYVDEVTEQNKCNLKYDGEIYYFVTEPRLLEPRKEMLGRDMTKWIKDLIDGDKIRFMTANAMLECMSIIYRI